MASINVSGSFSNIDKWLAKMARGSFFNTLNQYGEDGVAALAAATPVDSGVSAASWSYEVSVSGNNAKITWKNNHVDDQGTPIVIMLQHGHGTGTGGYVQGRDFINPAIKPIFDKIEQGVWKAVMS
jgi:hypothetical protein